MNAHEQLVERIVKEVTAALQKRAAGSSPAPQPAARPVLANKVITAESLEQSVNGDREILIRAGSILTPSARDFLRQRGINWSTAEAGTQTQTNTASEHWLAIVVNSTPAVATVLEQHAADWKQLRAADTAEAAATTVSAICRADADVVVVLAAQPEAVACRANRNASVRAAAVGDILEIKTAQQSMGANVFCCDPKQKPFFELRNLLKAITAKTTQPPSNWRE